MGNKKARRQQVWADVEGEMKQRIFDAAANDLEAVKQPDFLPSAQRQARELLAQRAKEAGVEITEEQYGLLATAVTLSYASRVIDLGKMPLKVIDRPEGEAEKGDEGTLLPGEVLTKREQREMLEGVLRRLRRKKVLPPKAE